ncbi:hypothetical protein PCK1_002713 [Pneumocystis canis]|nr:hypothetical protein PCK1_002713 [Pneumocystis canis]
MFPQNEKIRSSINELNKEFKEFLVFPVDYIKTILLDNSKKSNEQELFSYFLGPNQNLQIKKFVNEEGIYKLMKGFSESLYTLHFYLVGRLIFMLCLHSDVICKSMIDYITTNPINMEFLSKIPNDIIETIFLIFSKKHLWLCTKTWELSLLNFFNIISKEMEESKKERQIILLKNILNIFSSGNTVFQIFCDSHLLYSILTLFDYGNNKEIRKLSSLIMSELLKKNDITENSLENLIFDFILKCLENNTNKKKIEMYSIFIHLFTINSSIAASLFLKDGFLEEICSNIENDNNKVNIFLLEMISSSCINIDCRNKLLEVFIPILNNLKEQENIRISSLSKIIIMKLTDQINKKKDFHDKENILKLAKNIVSLISQDYIDIDMSLIEGLAYISMFSYVKEYLVSEKKIFTTISKRIKEDPTDNGFIFAALSCIKNIVNYKLKLTEEQKQIIKLKAMLQEPLENYHDILESDEKVTERCFKIINYQMLTTLNLASSCQSDNIKTLCSKIILSLSTEPKHRILLAKQGTIRILYNIIKDCQTGALTIEDSKDNFQYPAIISLVKMLITVNPNLIFDRSRFQVDDIVKSIYECLKVSENNDPLVQFECLLALTNLVSINIEIREKFVSILWPMIDSLWLSNNQLIQRSAVELLCNLVACPSGIEMFKKHKKRKIHILLALADSLDKKTRCAAGGALAILSGDLFICQTILEEKKGIKIILDMMTEETDDLIHRGLVCMANIIYSADSKNKLIFKELNIIEKLYSFHFLKNPTNIMHYIIIAPTSKIQEIKNILVNNNLYDKSRGIHQLKQEEKQEKCFKKYMIHTLRKKSIKSGNINTKIQEIFPELGNSTEDLNISITEDTLQKKNICQPKICINNFIHNFIQKICTKYGLDEKICFINIPSRWIIYGDMALLPMNTFSSSQWTFLFSTLDIFEKLSFYKGISECLGVTHLAMNAPIPFDDPMRVPIAFIPLYGDFGPNVLKNPTKKDFEEAYWVTTKQNGIYQVWSPVHTMFSRKNIKEKNRILRFPDVENEIIADLYAGIGYFAFSYLKAKAKKILCWEINPWSIEGLCRGAKLNNFTYKKVNNLHDSYDDQLIIFHNTNALANEQLAKKVKNIRHINLGLLPSSEDSWDVATKILDSKIGGWIHVHAAVCDKKIDDWVNKCRDKFIVLFKNEWNIKIEHIEKIKRFSSKLLHIVVDLFCIPKTKMPLFISSNSNIIQV